LSSGTSGVVRYGESASDPGDSSTSPNDAYLASGSGSGTVVLHNLGAGSLASDSTDAVNGGQVNTLATSLASALGGGSTFDASTGTITAPSYTIQGSTYSSVGSALSAVDSNLTNLQNKLNNLAAFGEQLQNQVNENRKIAAGGVAGAMAASQVRYGDTPGRFAFGLGSGYYDGQGALAVGAGVTTFDNQWRMNGVLSYAPGVSRMIGGGGASYSF
jgi:trimeric autotransporter adhesin